MDFANRLSEIVKRNWLSFSLKIFSLLVLAAVLVGATIVLYNYFGPIVFEAVGSLGSVFLSLLLVLLYFKQTNLIESQQEFEKRLERPVLHVEGHRPSDESGNHSARPLELLLSNTGRSPARDIELELISGFPEDAPLKSGKTTVPLQRVDSESDWNRDWGTYIEHGERNARYTVEPLMVGWFEADEPDDVNPAYHRRSKGYGLLWGELNDKLDEERIRLKGAVVYRGPGGSYREEIFDRVVELTAYGDLGTAVERGRRYRETHNYPIPTEVPDASLA